MKKVLLSLFFCSQIFSNAQSFDLVPLGVHGGGEENNLSSYLIGESGKNSFLCMDAGTVRAGIDKAIEKGVFSVSNETVLKDYIMGYFISHGHLDHLSGMVINSPDDSKKNIYSIPETAEILKNRYFTNDAWINFANEGDKPTLGKYTYRKMDTNAPFSIEGTNFTGRIFPLSHVNPYKSSAILVSNVQQESVLYLGDTGADRVEKSNALQNLWQNIAPLIKNKKLKAILIEVSFENERAENALFGHLTPKLLNEELSILAKTAQQKDLKDLKIIITHLKPGGNRIETIKKELTENNPLKVQLIFPEQGKKIQL
ncbi:cAMP phosphodiesterase [Elizabethkingia sp. YR214]|uniref:MBL fold metallo-hydrolase n=1 Tax=Elizabethkingia sp. YR214 TaxID=2135667 RepID=UPI000D3092EC|nr:3',5'-cyclic-nucleotide phosphodiesterase [Elizabethkingia sp. YR214]PUB30923.1 cAMP phosphodiesterase [Elizabethkingia sp. YR214]